VVEKILDDGIVEEGLVARQGIITFFKNLFGTSLIQTNCGHINSKHMPRLEMQKWFQKYVGKKYRIIIEFYEDGDSNEKTTE